MLHNYWFKPKGFGYGPSPRAGGWAFTGAYVFAVTVAAIVLLSSHGEARSLGAWVVFIVFTLCLTAIFALFCKAKTRGVALARWPGPRIEARIEPQAYKNETDSDRSYMLEIRICTPRSKASPS